MKYLQFLGKILTILSIVFVIWAITRMDYSFWQRLPKTPVFAVIVSCSVLYAIFFSFLSIGWFLLLKALCPGAKDIPFSVLNWIYAKSNLMKYLPGNVLEFVGRNIFTSKYGVPHKKIALASLFETIIIIIVSLTLGLISGFDILNSFFEKYDLTAKYYFIYLLAAMPIFAVPMCYFFFKKMKNQISFEKYKHLFKTICKVFLLQSLVFINLSLTFFLIFTYGFGMSLGLNDFLYILSGFTLSWTVGFITPGAPGGLGIKEVSLVSLLSARYGMEAPLVASVLHRIISVAGDILTYLISLLYLSFEKSSGQVELQLD
jgi:hypothetical protein